MTMNKEVFIQWNVQGMGSSKEDLMKLIETYKPAVIACQETWYGSHFISNIAGYKGACKQGHFNRRYHGGVVLYVNSACPYNIVKVDSEYQVVAARVNVAKNKTITCASLYVPPSKEMKEDSLKRMLDQLPRPVILMGDVNAHHIDWGNRRTDSRGRLIENLANTLNFSILNDGRPTHMTGTAVDLTIVSPELTPELNWRVTDNPLSSDHYPIIVTVVVERRVELEALNFKKANWEKIGKDEMWSKLDVIKYENARVASEEVYKVLDEIITRHVPKQRNRRYYPKTWWTQECKEAYKQRERSYRVYKRTGLVNDKITWKRNRAIATRTFRKAKQESWREYVSTLNVGTSSREIWKAVNKIRGRNTREIHMLKVGDRMYSEVEEIVEILAESFATVASEKSYEDKFLQYKISAEQSLLNFGSTNEEPYNRQITMQELEDAITTNNNTAPGPDSIHNKMLKSIPKESLPQILRFFNCIWNTSCIPREWKSATIVPIAKPDKDHTDPLNYRPISLTSCLSKTLEKIINRRLTEYLEYQKLLAHVQCGFRKFRGTCDHLSRFDTYIRKGLADGQRVTAVFFDLEKAYDMTWRYGILRDVHKVGIRGKMAHYIRNFLEDREFRVRVGSVYSAKKKQQTGVPQGSTLSVTLFALKIDSLSSVIPREVFSSMFVDDILIAYSHHNHQEVERTLQNTVNAITDWANYNGFKFSTKKTKTMKIYKGSEPAYNPEIRMGNKCIPVAASIKFLGTRVGL